MATATEAYQEVLDFILDQERAVMMDLKNASDDHQAIVQAGCLLGVCSIRRRVEKMLREAHYLAQPLEPTASEKTSAPVPVADDPTEVNKASWRGPAPESALPFTHPANAGQDNPSF